MNSIGRIFTHFLPHSLPPWVTHSSSNLFFGRCFIRSFCKYWDDPNLGQLRVIPAWVNFWWSQFGSFWVTHFGWEANLGWSEFGSTWGNLNLGQLLLIQIWVHLGRSQFGSTWGDLDLGQLVSHTWVGVTNLGWSQFGSTWGDPNLGQLEVIPNWVNLSSSQFGSTRVTHLDWLTNLGWSQF